MIQQKSRRARPMSAPARPAVTTTTTPPATSPTIPHRMKTAKTTTQATTPLRLHTNDAARWPTSARIVLGLLAGLYCAARLWRLTQFNLGRDEIFSLETARLDWGALLNAVVADVVH